jgi:hypothetical protein
VAPGLPESDGALVMDSSIGSGAAVVFLTNGGLSLVLSGIAEASAIADDIS